MLLILLFRGDIDSLVKGLVLLEQMVQDFFKTKFWFKYANVRLTRSHLQIRNDEKKEKLKVIQDEISDKKEQEKLHNPEDEHIKNVSITYLDRQESLSKIPHEEYRHFRIRKGKKLLLFGVKFVFN